MKMAAENCIEDYWEDASVSWGCRGLSLSSLSPHPQQAQPDGKPSNHMQDFPIAATLRPRSFPPPIALCTTLSIKAGGRFVLKEMASLPSHSFRAERQRGRLCLHLIEPKDLDDEDEEDGYNNGSTSEDDSACAHLHPQDEHKVDVPEEINESITSHEQAEYDSTHGLPQELGKALLEEESEPDTHACIEEASTSEKYAVEHIETREKSIGACMSSIVSASQIEIKKEGGAYMGGVLGIGGSLRNKESSNDIAACLSPCSSKHVLPHQSFARISPALGLAVS